MRIRFTFQGGPMDGKTVTGQCGGQDEADRYYALTNRGRIGQRFRTASQLAIDTLAREQLKEEHPHHFQAHVYQVVEHSERAGSILVRAEYVPKEA